MKLTKIQLAYLKNCRNGRGTFPTIPQLLWMMRRGWGPMLLLGGVGVLLVMFSHDVLGWLLIALAWGKIFASYATACRVHSTMPVFQAVVDWNRVDTLIKENERSNF
jgi:hypothetical protein